MMRKVYPYYWLLVVAFALTACTKDEALVTTPPTVGVNVVNAISDTIINFYHNGARQSVLTGIFPLRASGALQLPRGSQLLTFKPLYNNQSLGSVDTLFTLPVQLDSIGSNERYNIYVGGINRRSAFRVIDTIETDAQNARLKLVAASPQLTAFRVLVDGTLLFTSRTFKNVSVYKPVGGTGSKLIQILPAAGNNVLYTGTVTLNAGTSYTLFTSGSGAGFRAGLITNQ